MQKLPQQSRGSNILQVQQDQETDGFQQKENQYPIQGVPISTDFGFKNNNIVPQPTPQIVWVSQPVNLQQQFFINFKEQTRKYSVCFYILSYFYTIFYVSITAQRVMLSFLVAINIPSIIFFGIRYILFQSLGFRCAGMGAIFITTEWKRIGAVLSQFLTYIAIQIIFVFLQCKLIGITKQNLEDIAQKEQQIANLYQLQQQQNQ